MRCRRNRWSIRLASLATSLAPALLAGAQPMPGESQVNSYTTSRQELPSVASDADGDFVVVWHSQGSFGTDPSSSVQAQRYAANGSPLGAQFQVNTYTSGAQAYPAVAVDADGDFVVVWWSFGSPGTDTHGVSVQGRRFNSDGWPQGTQFQVNTYTLGNQYWPAVATDADGDFVVAWSSEYSSGPDTSYSIQARRYASDGSPQGAQFEVNSYTTGFQSVPSVAADSDGDFVVVWESLGSPGTDTSQFSVQGRLYASDGSPQGTQFQVNTYTTSDQGLPSVAARPGGDFVVVWASGGSTPLTGLSIQGQRYAANGSTQGGQFQVNSYTTDYQFFPKVAMEAEGDFVVAWYSQGSPANDTSGRSIQARRFAADGAPEGAQLQVNIYTTGDQRLPSVAMGTDGDFFITVWESAGSPGTDTSDRSIQCQGCRRAIAVSALSPRALAVLSAALVLLGTALTLRRRF